MSQRSPQANEPRTSSDAASQDARASTVQWSTRARVIASACLLFHLFAVFAAPCASPPPSSDAWSRLAGRTEGKDGLLVPYLRVAYLNHGYRFFAPNPGPSHLVRYEIDLKSGTSISGQFPDKDEFFPRLLYHRMFMISETAFNLASSVMELPQPGTLSASQQLEFDKQLAASDELAKSICRRLLQEYEGKRVRLYLRTHEIPFPNDVVDGQELDDSSLFREFPWRSYSKAQL